MRLLVPLLAAAWITGCSTFEADWEAGAAIPASPPGELIGRWQGTWRSDLNGHHGSLRCILTAQEDGTFKARYHATYGAALSFEYEVPMTAQRQAETWKFQGNADLGWLAGGVYHYLGEVCGDHFRSTYTAKRDRGTFEMVRS